jgi:hypothetical protein
MNIVALGVVPLHIRAAMTASGLREGANFSSPSRPIGALTAQATYSDDGNWHMRRMDCHEFARIGKSE